MAVGGDLSAERLIEAYKQGIFPWYSEESPILWWNPNPRMVLFPRKLKISKSLKQEIKRNRFVVALNKNFVEVLHHCANTPRLGQNGTWLLPEMQNAYFSLHQLGLAHSVEVYLESKLVGGLYGIAMGEMFFGESMFSLLPNTSKLALNYLCHIMPETGIIDCQVYTEHLERMGAVEVPRDWFLTQVNHLRSLSGDWLGPHLNESLNRIL